MSPCAELIDSNLEVLTSNQNCTGTRKPQIAIFLNGFRRDAELDFTMPATRRRKTAVKQEPYVRAQPAKESWVFKKEPSPAAESNVGIEGKSSSKRKPWFGAAGSGGEYYYTLPSLLLRGIKDVQNRYPYAKFQTLTARRNDGGVIKDPNDRDFLSVRLSCR